MRVAALRRSPSSRLYALAVGGVHGLWRRLRTVDAARRAAAAAAAATAAPPRVAPCGRRAASLVDPCPLAREVAPPPAGRGEGVGRGRGRGGDGAAAAAVGVPPSGDRRDGRFGPRVVAHALRLLDVRVVFDDPTRLDSHASTLGGWPALYGPIVAARGTPIESEPNYAVENKLRALFAGRARASSAKKYSSPFVNARERWVRSSRAPSTAAADFALKAPSTLVLLPSLARALPALLVHVLRDGRDAACSRAACSSLSASRCSGWSEPREVRAAALAELNVEARSWAQACAQGAAEVPLPCGALEDLVSADRRGGRRDAATDRLLWRQRCDAICCAAEHLRWSLGSEDPALMDCERLEMNASTSRRYRAHAGPAGRRRSESGGAENGGRSLRV